MTHSYVSYMYHDSFVCTVIDNDCSILRRLRPKSRPHQVNVSACVLCGVLQCATACCSVLQFTAMCCSALQCVAVCCSVLHVAHPTTPLAVPPKFTEVCVVRCVAVYCNVFQRVAECCRVLQSVAECYSVLHSVAVCCSVLHVAYAAIPLAVQPTSN